MLVEYISRYSVLKLKYCKNSIKIYSLFWSELLNWYPRKESASGAVSQPWRRAAVAIVFQINSGNWYNSMNPKRMGLVRVARRPTFQTIFTISEAVNRIIALYVHLQQPLLQDWFHL